MCACGRCLSPVATPSVIVHVVYGIRNSQIKCSFPLRRKIGVGKVSVGNILIRILYYDYMVFSEYLYLEFKTFSEYLYLEFNGPTRRANSVS